MHLDVEQIERLLHGELKGSDESSARRHLAECDDCRQRVALAQSETAGVQALLRRVDHDPPSLDVARVIARAAGRRSGWGRWAAGILLLLGTTGVLYAAPGSPLPGWLAKAAELLKGRGEPAPIAPPAAPSMAGIAVDPGPNLVISFTNAAPDSRVRVSLADRADLLVRAPSGLATFTSHVARLVVDNHGGAATFEIEVPRAAPRVEILVDGARIFLKAGDRVTTRDSTVETSPYLLPLDPKGVGSRE